MGGALGKCACVGLVDSKLTSDLCRSTISALRQQLLKAWGAHVTVTCSHNAEGLVRGLGADEVVDYAAGDAPKRLGTMQK